MFISIRNCLNLSYHAVSRNLGERSKRKIRFDTLNLLDLIRKSGMQYENECNICSLILYIPHCKRRTEKLAPTYIIAK